MMKLSLAIVLLLVPTFAQAWPWSHDMANQISIKPQESADLKNPGMRPYPKNSVPIPGTTSLVKDMAASEKQLNPILADDKSVELGGKLFQIYCTPCHGYSGKGDGLVGAKLLLKPFDLTAEQTKGRSDGFIWGYMTFGGAVMPSYANDLSATERWNVINYVRKVLQNGQSAVAVTPTAK
ncbi:putative Menaquinol oxidoreductase complex ACIII, monohaem cytochrome c subunit ActE [Candidatus Nitrotoga sp. HW29]|uniref:c-type cytochrome n=1 Tax=Candidatus Nitrotoga sp. HW29 TaxID=2886963 RepID=UPI001EF299A7|nr:cytochrome c [Candidatus Nitrotoga sp. HW29]CAH1904372.1 putative Menaquinol oxidoreductase complex ACIII, monohaem cytochrome c subunit ActE [Candidatus Nitrotoga sp. HW29]